jgi:membrane carboxypeptidase/penicillin-binding protein
MFQDPELNFRFPVSDSLTAYIDYRIASLTDSRETKKALRTKRANAIRNTILKPLLESGYLTQGQVDAFKTIEYKHPMIKNLKTILSDVHL